MFTHVDFGEQIVLRVCIHSFRITHIGPVDVQDEVAESRQWEDTEILSSDQRFLGGMICRLRLDLLQRLLMISTWSLSIIAKRVHRQSL